MAAIDLEPVAGPSDSMSSRTIHVTVNGVAHRSTVEARTLLVSYLRERLRLTGTHIGCDTAHCGACTVLIDGVAAKSCNVLAVQVDGRSVLTVEGLEVGGKLHPVQEGFTKEHGLQCGYCTPGMMLASVQLLTRNPNPTEAEIRRGISGNLCRCTGYVNIVKAVQYAAKKMQETPATPPKGGA
jgi:aerobic carbon-monoxide dehydrogenase small subunit